MAESDTATPAWRSSQLRLRPGVKALAGSEDAVLLVREHHADGTPFWTLPGGGVGPGESPVEALERELDEELRCRAVVGDRLGQFWYAHTSLQDTVSVYTVRDCHLCSRPDSVVEEGITAVRWADPSTLPTTTLPQVRSLVQRL